jgi:hypothetical protein
MKTATVLDFNKARSQSRQARVNHRSPLPAGFPLSPDQIWEFLGRNMKLPALKTAN